MKELGLYLIIFLLLLAGVAGMAKAQDYWKKGENRIINSDFEEDAVAGLPAEWALAKGG